ncbi:replication protein RepA [Xanthomonas euvesicatoria]|uniref:replication protein RepA n=1 Tax=Xanthomonas euvesicatoria TaxID=456327 RepID=UPI003557BA41
MNSQLIPERRKEKKLYETGAEIMGSAPEGDDIAFLHSTFCQVGLPRSKPKTNVFERKSGTAAIRLEAGPLFDGQKFVMQPLPYGTKPRLLLLHLQRSYLRTGNPVIDLGDSIRDFLQNTLNIDASGGKQGGLTGFKEQIKAFAACRMMIGWNMPSGAAVTRPAERIVEQFDAWPELAPGTGQRMLWPGSLTISDEFALSIQKASVPLDARAVRAIQDSALAIDLYAWLAHRLHRLERPALLHWKGLQEQFGTEISDRSNFKKNFTKSMRQVLAVYPNAKVESAFGGIKIYRSLPPVPKIMAVVGGKG